MNDSNEDDLFLNSVESYKGNYHDHLLEQYKIYVGMANEVSERRSKTNSFFLSANSFLITALGVLTNFKVSETMGFLWLYVSSAAGILFSISWLLLVRNYKQLNSSKYQVIHAMEKKLPSSPYGKEWQYLESGKNLKKYIKLTNIESTIPFLFIALYLTLSLGSYLTGLPKSP